MAKLQRRKRREKPAEVVKSLFGAFLLEFTSEFLKSESFGHALTKGEERETPVLEFFRNLLPKTYAICGGEVIDLCDRRSPQLDLMIWDQVRNFGFYSGSSVILPAEALLVSIEIKTKLTAAELTKSLKASVKLYELQPFKEPLSHARIGGETADSRCRYFHCIFAYGSDLANNTDWLQNECKRFDNAVRQIGCPVGNIERIYVANRGVLNPRKNWGLREDPIQGIALMHFYLDIFNFLCNENRRREFAPYIGYIGQIGKTNWQKLRKSH